MKLKQYAFYFPYFVFFVSFISTIVSLFFSEVLKYPPCVLCWYQRIFMFPLLFISAVNITRKHKELPYYILPLSIIGFFIALYQNLLIWKILPESVAPCTVGVSCVNQPFTLFGFITIPLGSMMAFAFITASMIIYEMLLRQNVRHLSGERVNASKYTQTKKIRIRRYSH